tara:strand:+ start:1255 stop:2109 length:855 start_codon:yes stop_codon:yes gene_type:complete
LLISFFINLRGFFSQIYIQIIVMLSIKSKKKFGQHFLINEKKALTIVNNLSCRENVLEIGPGKGVLTKYLLEKKIKNFIVSEIDQDCVKYLKKTYQKIQIIEGDILKVKLNNIFNNNFSIISNLPYYISSQILFSILENRDSISEFVILIQKEVAERICSKPKSKNYGILSVLLQTFYDLEYLFDIGAEEFKPKPKVQSAVLKATRNNTKDIGTNFFFYKNVVKLSFQNRRKTLRNSLKNLNLPQDFTSKNIFSKRAEQLDINDFIWLANEIKKNNQNEIFSNE